MEERIKQARSTSLNNLIGAMEDDDAMSIKSVVLKISATPEGIRIEQEGGGGTGEVNPAGAGKMEGCECGEDSEGCEICKGSGTGNGFENLIQKKKRERMGTGG